MPILPLDYPEPFAGTLEPDPDAGHRVLTRDGVLDVDDERAGHGGGP